VVVTNSAPEVIAVLADVEVEVDTAITPIDVSVAFTDSDGDELTYGFNVLPDGLTFDFDTGLIEGTPTAVGTVAVTVGVVDLDGSNTIVAADPFNIEVVPQTVANLGPEFDGTIDDLTIAVGEDIQTIEAGDFFSDPEDDILEFAATGLPDGLVIDALTGDIDGAALASGDFPVTVSAIDTLGSETLAVSNAFDILVEAAVLANLAPVFNGPIDDFSLEVDVEIPTFDVSAFFSDPENDDLTFFADQLPAGLELDADSGLIEGTPTDAETLSVIIEALDADGSGTPTPSNSVEIIVVAGDAS